MSVLTRLSRHRGADPGLDDDERPQPTSAVNGHSGGPSAEAPEIAVVAASVAHERDAEQPTAPVPAVADIEAAPGLRERGRIRRRARYLRRLREIQLRDIGGLALELHRLGRRREDLIEQKLAAAAETDRELRVLERALDERSPLRELREAGIGGACAACGSVFGSGDRFCAACGERVGLSVPAEVSAQ
jgi:hypothetical protein